MFWPTYHPLLRCIPISRASCSMPGGNYSHSILPTAQSPLSTWLQANDLIGLAPSVLVAHEAITIHYLFLPWNPFPDDNHRTRDERHVGWSSIRMPTYPRK